MLHSRMKFLAFAAVVVLLFPAAACSGGGESDDTAREISNEELGQMVLGPEQFGPEFAGFSSGDENGPQTVEQIANEDDDPAAERADLEQHGFTDGYKMLYYTQQPPGGQVASVGSLVYLFETAEGAAGYLEDSIAEMRDDQEDEDPSAIFEWSDLDAGDEAVSLRFDGPQPTDEGSTISLSGTVIFFRHGRIVAGMLLYGFALPDPEKQRLHGNMETLASVMNDRITSVLATAAAPSA